MIISHPKTCLHTYDVLSIQFNSIQSSSQKNVAQSLSCCSMSRSKDKRESVNQITTYNQQPTAWGISSERVLQNGNKESKEMTSGENPSREQVKARVVDAEMQIRKSKPFPPSCIARTLGPRTPDKNRTKRRKKGTRRDITLYKGK